MNRTAYGSYTHPDDPGEPATKSPRISVTDDEAELLAFLAHRKKVLEIGTGLGVSTRAMATTAGMLTTVDNDVWVQDHIWPDLPNRVFTLTEREPGVGYDMVFIDGEHKTADTRDDIEYARTVCRRGLIVVHDANMESVQKALDSDWYLIPTYHGIALQYVGWDT